MSRNLGRTSCAMCAGKIKLVESPRPITREDVGVTFIYYEEYRDLIVAHAECRACGAKYLAWVRDPRDHGPQQSDAFYDLSYRSTFNDEPGAADMPVRRPITITVAVDPPRCAAGHALELRASVPNYLHYCYNCRGYSSVQTATLPAALEVALDTLEQAGLLPLGRPRVDGKEST